MVTMARSKQEGFVVRRRVVEAGDVPVTKVEPVRGRPAERETPGHVYAHVWLRRYTTPGTAIQGRVRGQAAGPPGGLLAEPRHGRLSETLVNEAKLRDRFAEAGIRVQKRRVRGAIAWIQHSPSGSFVVAREIPAVIEALTDLGLKPQAPSAGGAVRWWTLI